MDRRKEVVLFTPSGGPDPNACPKCKTIMEPFDGPDIKGVNHRGLLCSRCRYFKGKKATKSAKSRRGKIDPRKFGELERDFEGRIRPKNMQRRTY